MTVDNPPTGTIQNQMISQGLFGPESAEYIYLCYLSMSWRLLNSILL